MSWDSFIDNLISQTKDNTGKVNADKVCIIGLDGGALWTSPGHAHGFNLEPRESLQIANCFKSKDFTRFMSDGIYLERTRYLFLRNEGDKLVLGKMKNYGAVTLQASKTAIVIAHCQEGGQHGCTNKGVAIIVEYLESVNM